MLLIMQHSLWVALSSGNLSFRLYLDLLRFLALSPRLREPTGLCLSSCPLSHSLESLERSKLGQCSGSPTLFPDSQGVTALLSTASRVLKAPVSHSFFWLCDCLKQIKSGPCYSILARSRSSDARLLSQVYSYAELAGSWLPLWKCCYPSSPYNPHSYLVPRS